MNWEVVIGIISIIISIFTLLFFSIYPYIKKTMINKTFIRIENFYNIYSYLNPCFLYRLDGTKNITSQLVSQSFLAKGFPKFRYLIEKNYYNFDPFVLQDTNWANKLTIKEIFYFYSFWKKAIVKIEYIKKIINKYEYIMSVVGDTEQITYRDSFDPIIDKSSISLCPSFDKMRLYSFLIGPAMEYKETKFNLDEIVKLENNKKFIDELKSKKFCVNLTFKNTIKVNIYSYSIIFNDKCVISIEPFFDKNIIHLNKIDEQEIRKHLEWIDKTFNIDSKSLLNEHPHRVRSFKL